MPNRFAAELAQWGPNAQYGAPALHEAQRYCRRLASSHYENFSVTSVFVPRGLRQHFYNVYSYCRWADDLADESGDQDAAHLLSWWRVEVLKCYDGKPVHPVMVALQHTIQQFEIPAKSFLDLLVAFEQDQRVKSYATFDDLLGYCKNSANPVGRLVLYLGRCHDEERGQLSDRICTALQLTNFWQDVARDLDIGRNYVPVEDRTAFGYSDDDFCSRKFTPAFRQLMEFQVERTRRMFQDGMPLLKLAPKNLRLQVELFARGGLAVLDKIEKQGFDVWSSRPTLSKLEKATLMARVIGRRVRRAVSA